MAFLRGAIESLLSYINDLLESPRDIIEKVENLIKNFKRLKSEDVRARGEFRKQLRKLNELLHEVELYRDAIIDHPVCTKERTDAIFTELNSKDQYEQYFNVDDRTRFPRSISFLRELDTWVKSVEEQYQKVDSLHKKFEKETQKMAEIAQDAAKVSKAEKEKTIKAWAKVGLLIGTIGGAITGGAALPVFMGVGAVLPVVVTGIGVGVGAGASAGAIAGAGAGVIASSDDAQDESTHDELRKKYDEINEKASDLQQFSKECKMRSKVHVLIKEKDVVSCPEMPLLCELKPKFEKMFNLLNEDRDYGNLKEIKKDIDKEMVKEGIKK